ncbi:MAG TPA: DedA family protein [Candidatus Saccharimonadia bacterium]|nr:DedA family protein [Candidatus Saccharimonadia bacterium]
MIHKLGLLGIAVAVFLNGLSVPGLSEVLLPLAGVAVKRGQLNLAGLLIVAMVAQLLGVSLAYVIGKRGGRPIIERYGRYILVSHQELEQAEKLFERYGSRLVIVGAFIPGLQGLMGYVAGIASMNYQRFLMAIFVGKLVWIGGLVYLGTVVGNHVEVIDRYIKQIGVVVLAAVLILGIWYVRRHRRHREKTN